MSGFHAPGSGIGFAGSQLTNVILSEIPNERSGAASGANTTVRQLGAALDAMRVSLKSAGPGGYAAALTSILDQADNIRDIAQALTDERGDGGDAPLLKWSELLRANVSSRLRDALADADQSAPAGCLTYEMATEAATRALENEPDGRLMLFAGLDAAALLKAINDQPPQTDFRADRILVLQRAAKDNVRIGLIVDGCFRGPFAMKEADWEKLKAAVAEQFSS